MRGGGGENTEKGMGKAAMSEQATEHKREHEKRKGGGAL